MKKNDKGITMLSLVVMLVVLMMLATITMYYGNSAMKEAKLQDLKTNMLLIQAAVKGDLEKYHFETSNLSDSEKISKKSQYLKGIPIENAESDIKVKFDALANNTEIQLKTQISDDYQQVGGKFDYYYLDTNTLSQLGLKDVQSNDENGYYIVAYSMNPNYSNIVEVINTKGYLGNYSLEYFIKEYTIGNVTDYQAAALVMAIYINGMNEQEITNLSLAMAHSGEILDLSSLGENIVDKHSTGGVGDKVSIILLPLIASLGIPVAKMSGRGLGFTGGTVDKMESIPGYKTNVEISDFILNVQKIGISMIGQTMNLAPADKKLYALRDTISCVESIPLIASSIMSKKIASGANKIVLDVTVGKGAFMKNKEDAQKLADLMIRIGELAGREVVCVLTKMDEPLGYSIGNNLEVIEAIKFLKGYMPKDLKDVVFELGANMIKLAGLGENLEENKLKIQENIVNGKGYEKFLQMVQNQGGDISYINNIDKFEKSKYIIPVTSLKSGIISDINAEDIGKVACLLGAGRIRKEDNIDYTAGIVLNKKVGDYVKENEILAYIHTNNENVIKEAIEKIQNICKI